jgi:thiol-disulfide isomerase/thioredoxin
MNSNKVLTWLKKNAGNIVIYGLLLLLVFSPGVKSWLLQQAVSTGLFKAKIKKEGVEKSAVPYSFSFINEQQQQVDIASLKGKVVFINFWASWCPPCRAEMPSLNQLFKELRDDSRFAILFLNEDEDQQKGKDYLKKNNFEIPFQYANGGVPSTIFSGTLPTTVVLNKEGKLVMKHTGIAKYDNEDFITQLKSLL